MRVGIIGTGAIAAKHAEAYRNIGFKIVACTNPTPSSGEAFAAKHGAEFVPTVELLCSHPDVEYVDVCTFPNFRLPAVELCARFGKHIQVQKPIATDVPTARRMVEIARGAGIQLGVVSQHRFDDATLFLKRALEANRLGRILQADAYVKWFRSAEYYSRPAKGTWAVEGGGALINQAVHQVDLLLHFAGAVERIYADWQIGGLHAIESEDSLTGVLRYASGALGCLQASTSVWPGFPERTELHGTKGTAIIQGDKLALWDVKDDQGDPPPLAESTTSGSSDPMAIGTLSFERLFLNFAHACRTGQRPQSSGEDGLAALEVVSAAYESCRTAASIRIGAGPTA